MSLWLEAKLKQSNAKWKIVIAHHPIWSSSGSKFEQGRSLRKLIMPAMCRYADAYIVGHEHTMEIHEDNCEATMGEAMDPPLVQIVSGAASKQRPLNTNFMRQQEAKYPGHKTIWAEGLLWGFAHMTVEGDTASVTLLSVPDDGGSEHTVDFEYQFERRSHQVNTKQ
jgi:tartrate-resistant acid phosphatase type 5